MYKKVDWGNIHPDLGMKWHRLKNYLAN